MSLTITRPSIQVPLPLTRGGTEATTPAGARAKLELGDLALLTAPGGTATFLRADNTWAVPPGGGGGGGDVSSSAGLSVDSELALFDGTSGKLLKRGTGTGLARLTSGVLGTVAAPTGAVVGTTDTQTLTGKTLSGASNTLTVRDLDLAFTDVTTANVSTTQHGLTPKAPGGTTQFLRGDATWGVPPAGVSTFLALSDTPDAYTGQAGKFLSVTAGATALEFVDAPTGGGGFEHEWTWTTATSGAVVNKHIGINHADPTLATQIRATDLTLANADASNLFRLLAAGATWYIQDVNNAATAVEYQLTGAGTDMTDWWTFPVVYVRGGSVAISNNQDSLSFLALAGSGGGGGGGGESYWSRVDLGQSTLATGIRAFWTLDEATGTRLDSVGTTHLLPTGSPPQVTNAVGKIGQALAMNGTNNTYLSVPDTALLSAGANQSFTVACWVYVATTASNMGFVGKGSAVVDTKNVEYMLWQYQDAWNFVVGNGVSFVNLASPTPPVINQWSLLIGWYDADTDMQYLQVNNGTAAQVSNPGGSYDSTLPFEVGRTVGFATQSLNGRLDMPAFWPRVLTPAERADYWQNGNGLAYPFGTPARLSPTTASDHLLLAASAVSQERLEVDGAIKLGNAVGTVDGTLRWTGTDFEGRKGGAWVPLASPTLPLAIADGGTGATTAATARTNLGLGTLAVQNANAVAMTGGTAVLTTLYAERLGVGATPPATPNFTQLNGPVGIQENANGLFALALTYNKLAQYGLAVHTVGGDTGNLTVAFVNVGGSVVGSINATAAATAFNTSSDVRLKFDIQPLTGVLDVIRALRPVAFRWQADGSPGTGFLAHALQQVIPDAVTGEPDAVHADGSVKPQQVDHSKLVVWLVAGMQQLLAQLDALTARVATLEAALT